MGLEPESETGKRMLAVLKSHMSKTHNDPTFSKLKRLLCMYSSRVKNEEDFILALHGQSVLDEDPSALVSYAVLFRGFVGNTNQVDRLHVFQLESI